MKNFQRFSIVNLAYTLLVIVWGAYVRATGSGAGCGDHWPLCNGMVIPRTDELKTAIEFAHRTSSGLSLLLVVFGYFWARKLAPKGTWIRRAAFLSVIAIFLEAILGAGLVLLKLVEFDQSALRAVSIALHLVNTLFLVSTLTTVTWFSFQPVLKSKQWFPKDRFYIFCLGVFVFLGMSGAITALGDTLFPASSLAQGMAQDFQHDAHFLVRLRVIHPMVAVVWMMLVFVWSKRFEKPATQWVRSSLVLAMVLQFILGILNWVLMAPTLLQLIHLLVANLVFITFWIAGIVARSEEAA